MAYWYDRVKESGRIVASGDIILLGAYPGFRTFKSVFGYAGSVGIGSSQSGVGRAYYTFESGSTWEVGYGFISGGSPGMSPNDGIKRDIIYSSSQNNKKVDVTSGIYTVFHNPPAKHLDDLDLLGYMGMI